MPGMGIDNLKHKLLNELMGKLINLLVIILLIFELHHSFYLRGIGYDQIPETSIVLDERTWVWQGLSIRSSGIPAGWSELPVYRKGFGKVDGLNLAYDGIKPNLSNYSNFPKPIHSIVEMDNGKGIRHTVLVQPLIEKAPLGGLILSLWVPSSVKTFTDLVPHDLRKGSLYMAVVTQTLIFVLAWQVFKNPWIGLLSSTLYGNIPIYLLMSRYALLENVMNPFLLLMLILLNFTKDYPHKSKILLVLCGVVAGLATLVKITAWAFVLVGFFLLLYWRIRFKSTAFFLIPAILVGFLYFIWGFYLDPKLFYDIFFHLGTYEGFVGSLNFLTNAVKVNILHFPFEGWWLMGFISLILLPKQKELSSIYSAIIAGLVAAIAFVGYNNPWYYIPLIPFFCIAIASFFWMVATKPSLFNIPIFFLGFFSISFFWGYIVYKTPAELPYWAYQKYNLYRFLFFFFMICGLGWSLYQSKKIKFLWIILMLFIIFYMLIWNERSLFYILSHWGKIPEIVVLE